MCDDTFDEDDVSSANEIQLVARVNIGTVKRGSFDNAWTALINEIRKFLSIQNGYYKIV